MFNKKEIDSFVSDLKEFLPELLNKINLITLENKDSKWIEFCQKLKEKYCFENYKET